MIVETIMCPSSNHHRLGWWIWLQAGLSLTVFVRALAFLGAGRAASRAGVRA